MTRGTTPQNYRVRTNAGGLTAAEATARTTPLAELLSWAICPAGSGVSSNSHPTGYGILGALPTISWRKNRNLCWRRNAFSAVAGADTGNTSLRPRFL